MDLASELEEDANEIPGNVTFEEVEEAESQVEEGLSGSARVFPIPTGNLQAKGLSAQLDYIRLLLNCPTRSSSPYHHSRRLTPLVPLHLYGSFVRPVHANQGLGFSHCSPS